MSMRTSLRRCHGILSGATSSPSTSCLRHTQKVGTARQKLNQARCLHSMPSIGQYDEMFKREGVKDLYSPEGYAQAWTEYQGHIIDQLNTVLAGDERAEWEPKSILIDTSRDPSKAHIFNYASMAHNNHFYMKCLSPKTVAMPKDLSNSLSESFSSLDTLKQTFLATAAGMFGPGFVWLVQTFDSANDNSARRGSVFARNPLGGSQAPPSDFQILTTYLAGSPYPGAHWRQQPRDMNTENMGTQEGFMRLTAAQGSGNTFDRRQQEQRGQNFSDTRRFNQADLIPVLCVSTWEHAWIRDWGVAGKREFLEKWWTKINWETVAGHCHMAGQDMFS